MRPHPQLIKPLKTKSQASAEQDELFSPKRRNLSPAEQCGIRLLGATRLSLWAIRQALKIVDQAGCEYPLLSAHRPLILAVVFLGALLLAYLAPSKARRAVALFTWMGALLADILVCASGWLAFGC